jgi:L-2,4-diaminobutyric acid acetyltransferase
MSYSNSGTGHGNGSLKKEIPIPFEIRIPDPAEGLSIHRLVSDSPPLDPNSVYCNLLQCTHFATTCRVAVSGDQIVAFVTGYRKPADPDVLFIWQVCASEAVRGQGIAQRLIESILDEEAGLTALETTITESNRSSWRLFEAVSNQRQGTMESSPFFLKDRHFGGLHDTEFLVRIDFPS